jgi:hypothetical protein
MERYLLGIGLFVGLALFWVAIQAIWRKTFADNIYEDDVLAARGNCTNCGCMGGVCEDKK